MTGVQTCALPISRLAEAESKVGPQQEQLKARETELAEAKTRAAQLAQELEAARASGGATTEELTRLRQQVQESAQRVATAEAKLGPQQEELQRREALVAELNARLSQVSAELETARNSGGNAGREVTALKIGRASCRERV